MRNSPVWAFCSLAVGLLMVNPAAFSTEGGDSVVIVTIKDFTFEPATVKIKSGQTVVWINSDQEPHAVAANDRAYRSSTLDTGEKYSRKFATSGEFAYFCTLHPHMVGKVVVEHASP